MSDAAAGTTPETSSQTSLVESLGTAGRNSPDTKGRSEPTTVAELFQLTNMVVK